MQIVHTVLDLWQVVEIQLEALTELLISFLLFFCCKKRSI
jgi:hypothetical protein